MITILLEKIKALLTETKTILSEKTFGEPFYCPDAVVVGDWVDGKKVYKRSFYKEYTTDTSYSYFDIGIPSGSFFIGCDPRATFFDCVANTDYTLKPNKRYGFNNVLSTSVNDIMRYTYNPASDPNNVRLSLGGGNTMYHIKYISITWYYAK